MWLRSHCPGNERVREHRRKIYLGPDGTCPWNRPKIEQRLKRFSQEEFFRNDNVGGGIKRLLDVNNIFVFKMLILDVA